jgi:hypothetical protein
MIDPDETVTFNGAAMAIRDVPDQFVRAMLGYGHGPHDIKARIQWPGVGPYQPAECLRADEIQGIWINDEETLVCPGCGLDFT